MTEPRSGAFLSDIQTLRQRAREHIAQGAVTPGYHADRAVVLKLLNEALATEIVCTLRYKRHYYMAQGIHAEGVDWHLGYLSAQLRGLGNSEDVVPLAQLAVIGQTTAGLAHKPDRRGIGLFMLAGVKKTCDTCLWWHLSGGRMSLHYIFL